jgi:hypothetical protein
MWSLLRKRFVRSCLACGSLGGLACRDLGLPFATAVRAGAEDGEPQVRRGRCLSTRAHEVVAGCSPTDARNRSAGVSLPLYSRSMRLMCRRRSSVPRQEIS